jgi:hypothetical protein
VGGLTLEPLHDAPPVAPGDVVVMREVWGDRVLAARPLRVAQVERDHLAFWFAPGTAWKNDPREHGEVRFFDGPWELENLVRERPVLSFAFPETPYAVLLTWNTDGTFDGYYLNIQSPLRRTAAGYDYVDWFLDVEIPPDRSTYRWKDEDELAEALARGLVTESQAHDIRWAGERAIEHVLLGEPPFHRDWTNWEPNPSWPVPVLPP